jgi:uncharacterized membrane protein
MKIEIRMIKGLGPVGFVDIFNKKYAFCICHHLEDRSFKIFGIERYLCSRCCGITIGGILGFIGRFAEIVLPINICVVFMIPLLLDGFIQAHTKYRSTNYRRFFTGILFAVGIVFLTKNFQFFH